MKTHPINQITCKKRANGTVEVQGPGIRQFWHPWDSPGGGFRIEDLPSSEAGSGLGLDGRLLLDAIYTFPKSHPLARLIRSVPESVLARVTALLRYHYEALLLAQSRPSDFARCPTLILMAVLRAMALPLSTFDLNGDAMHWARQVCVNPQLAIHVARRYEHSIRGDLFHAPNEAIVWPAFANKAALRVLRHVPGLCDEHLMLAGLCEVIPRSPLLAYAAGNGKYAIFTQCSRIIALRHRLRLPPWPYGSEVATLAQLWRIGDRLAIRAVRARLCAHVVYPTPPYPPDGYVRWISTEEELREIAESYCNCVSSFHASCLAGLAAVYEAQDMGKQRYVVVLSRQEEEWRLTGAEYPEGQSVPESEKQWVFAYLKGAQA